MCDGVAVGGERDRLGTPDIALIDIGCDRRANEALIACLRVDGYESRWLGCTRRHHPCSSAGDRHRRGHRIELALEGMEFSIVDDDEP